MCEEAPVTCVLYILLILPERLLPTASGNFFFSSLKDANPNEAPTCAVISVLDNACAADSASPGEAGRCPVSISEEGAVSDNVCGCAADRRVISNSESPLAN